MSAVTQSDLDDFRAEIASMLANVASGTAAKPDSDDEPKAKAVEEVGHVMAEAFGELPNVENGSQKRRGDGS